ncbi:Signal transduction histidine kinase [Cohaesibacter marisflavi]|uniref:histidine kinase n=2 Tax=Cohaesibacter marisflavi TaxID=655353 RepID=A0A1I5A509_9HYPH|nr:Signal transduction histidine kinase [Cohaesibacter marisflavi]
MKSITRYLVINISIWALLAALSAGVILTSLFRTSAEDAFDGQLDMVLKMLVGELATQLFSSEELSRPGSLGQPRFELPLSGWYWTVSRSNKDELVFASLSLGGENLTVESQSEKQYTGGIGRYLMGKGPDGKRIRILEREISFGPDQSYYFRVTGNAAELDEQIRSFENRAWLLMVLFGVVLLTASLLLVRTALRPLTKLQRRVRDVAIGKSEAIVGSYPVEVDGLVEEANILISSNKETLERARTQLGNLAHALKTPLSVITNEVRSSDLQNADMLVQQVDVMRDQIQLYLDRARFAARHNTIGTVTKADPVLKKLTGVMSKIHPEKMVDYECSADSDICFRGEEQDLEEMIGNLVDNACKWASSRVVVSLTEGLEEAAVKRPQKKNANVRKWLSIIVEDDGPGISEGKIDEALKRGKRLDESKPGSGLGLSIVTEIANLYQGTFSLERASLGGLRAELVLPAIKEE